MEDKTLGHLNIKTWYRFLKVIFIIALVAVFGGYNFFVFSEGVKKVDDKNTTIQCNVGAKRIFTPNDTAGLYLKSSDFINGKFDYKRFYEDYNDYNIGEIIKKCYPKATGNVYDVQRQVELMNKHGFLGADGSVNSVSSAQMTAYEADYNIYIKETSNLYGNTKTNYLDFTFHNFDINPIFTYTSFLKFLFLGNILILFVFEVMRRSFYYVVLGKIKPDN